MLIGRGTRSQAAWRARVSLAERLGACVMTDLKTGAMFPTEHPAHVVEPFNQMPGPAREILREADLILSLDWIDLGGALRQAKTAGRSRPRSSTPASTSTCITAPTWTTWSCRRSTCRSPQPRRRPWPSCSRRCHGNRASRGGRGRRRERPPPTASASRWRRWPPRSAALSTIPKRSSFAGLARGWPVELWPFRDPLAYLGKDGGGGIGSGPGISVGAALALHTRGRLTVSVLGDGDFAMGVKRSLDGRAPPHPAADPRQQQPLLFQRRAASGNRRRAARARAGQPLDRPAPIRSGAGPRQAGRGAGRRRHRPGDGGRTRSKRPSSKESPCCGRAASASSTSMSIREPNATPPPPSASAPQAAESLLFPPFQRTKRRSPGATVNEPLPGVVVMQHRPPNCLTRPLNRLALVDQRNVPRMVVIATGTPRS